MTSPFGSVELGTILSLKISRLRPHVCLLMMQRQDKERERPVLVLARISRPIERRELTRCYTRSGKLRYGKSCRLDSA